MKNDIYNNEQGFKDMKKSVTQYHAQLAFFINLKRAVIGPSATLSIRWAYKSEGTFSHVAAYNKK